MKWTLRIFASVLLVWASPAWATWHTLSNCSDSAITNPAPNASLPVIFHCPTTTGNSPLFFPARHWHLDFDPDIGGAAGTHRIHVVKCITSTISTNSCSRVVVDSNGDAVLDNVALDGDNGAASGQQNRWRFNFPPGVYYIESTVAKTGGETPLVRVETEVP